MALRVDTQLSSSVYFPGDELSCAIQVANNFPDVNPTLPILWISVQVFGYIQVHKYWKLSSIDVFSDADILGSYVLKQPIFQEKSKKQRIHFFATDEQVVACDLKLKDYQTYVYSIKLPQTLEGGVSPLPPSFPTFIPNEILSISGNENKTSYNSRIRYVLSISLKTALTQPLQVIQLPIHVLSPLCSTNKISFSYNSYKQLHRIGKSKEVNKLITTQDPIIIDELKIKNVDEEERDLEIIYRPSTYRISKDDEVFVHFSISSSIFTLGDTIGCTLSFSPTSPVHCFQTTVALECREQINAELLTPDMNKPARSFLRKLVYGEYQESSVSSLQSSFTFNIPVDAIHEFQSDIVTVKWYLSFEFLVGERKDITNVRRFENRKKEVVSVEQISWELPIKVSIYDRPSELRCPTTLVWNIQP